MATCAKNGSETAWLQGLSVWEGGRKTTGPLMVSAMGATHLPGTLCLRAFAHAAPRLGMLFPVAAWLHTCSNVVFLP